MSRLRRTVATVPAMALVITGAALVSTADAAPHSQTVSSCGTVITGHGRFTVTADIGPCTGDGIDIQSNGVTLMLDGHTIAGSNATNTTNNQQLGVALMNTHGVKVEGPGTITKFDAGVAVNGGSGNRIQGLNVHDNIAHVLLTGGVDLDNPLATACDYGDGITTDDSSNNTITGNTATHNGPFSGISLVDNSDGNQVTNNTASNQTVSNIMQVGANAGKGGPCGPMGANPVGQGRPHQDTGIRVEGPGANQNTIANNTVTDNQLEGIAIFDNICPNNAEGVPTTPANDDNVVTSNTVLRNGGTDGMDGIGVLSQGPTGVVCVPSGTVIQNNTSNSNTGNGISVGGRGSHDSTITGNTADNNGKDGIHLAGPTIDSDTGAIIVAGAINNTITTNTALNNAGFDGFDGNPNCDNNNWANNRFQTVNQLCVAGNGGSGTVPPTP